MSETPVAPLQEQSVGSITDDLTVVSNRQPYRHRIDEQSSDGRAVVDQPAGGLTAGLDPVLQRIEGTWIAWGDGNQDFDVTDENDCIEVPPDESSYLLHRLSLTDEEVQGYSSGYSNRMLWPLCHSMLSKTVARPGDWNTYCQVNEKFATAVSEHANARTTVWFQDYHLALAPAMVRSRTGPDSFLMHFWHIPWPSPDVFSTCPHRDELISGLLGNDLLVFHLEEYAVNFLNCVDRISSGAITDWDNMRIHHEQGTTSVVAAPMGIDSDEIRDHSETVDGEFWRGFRLEHGIDEETSVAVGVDRLDYTKGITNRLDALERFWETNPDWRGELTYVQKGSESRSEIPAYRAVQQEVAETIDRINERFGTDDWQPIVYTTAMLSREDLVSLYYHSDVGLVTPLRDGLNLVAQEYIAAQSDDEGVLVLSELAGCSNSLESGALTVNPYYIDGMATAIGTALTMSDRERQHRCRELRKIVHAENMESWIEDLFDTAHTVKTNGE